MNENLNLIAILKDCPEGTKLYSTVFGEVEFEGINDIVGPIIVETKTGNAEYFTVDGKMFENYDGECILFPSREQRDWSKFKYEKKELVPPCKFKIGDKIVNILRKDMGASGTQGIISEITDDKYIFTDGSFIFISNQDNWELVSNKFDPKTLKPFDKVLVRRGNENYDVWFPDFVSDPPNDTNNKTLCMCIMEDMAMVIPYNDETKHLVGTAEEAPLYYRFWED